MQKPVPALLLPVPVVDALHLHLRHDDEVCHADARALSQPRERWRVLEGPLGPGRLDQGTLAKLTSMHDVDNSDAIAWEAALG